MDNPMTDAIASAVVDKLPMEETDPRLMPGLHLSVFWGMLRIDFNLPIEPSAIVQIGGGL
jgi:hypothetical protein